MPRSFLVKKYFTSKKPNYSELESQSGPLSAGVPERYPLAELPTGENGLSTACCPAGLVWDVSILPGLYTPEPVSIPSPTGPLDLSSSHSSSSEEDEGRSSDPPSPEPAERHQCPNCGKSYGGPAALSRHRLSCCEKDEAAAPATRPAFRCKHCTKEYNSLGALKMHIRSHTLPCVCATCGKAFSRPWLLRGHIRTHTGERPFSCPHCSRAFADRSNLRAHLQTHSEVKKYQCAGCSRTFSRMSLLHKHTVAGCCSSPSS
ncbi:snail family zinc finger 1b [Paramormyrops kingsleyae]|uniref:snail family zinc finger 1b n=1 Tax=Paramormyrops kingsleyae TaxID=1676925 RepID=UPI003B974DE8